MESKRFAEIVQQLHAAGAKVVSFDLLLTEPESAVDRALPRRRHQGLEPFDRSLKERQHEAFDATPLPLQQASGPDAAFAAAMREAGNVVLPFAVTVSVTSPQIQPVQLPPPIIARAAYRILQNLHSGQPPVALRGSQILAPIEAIAHSATALGHVNVALDTDGAPRYDYPVVEYQREYYPSFAVQIVRTYLGLQPEEVRVRFGEGDPAGVAGHPDR